MEQNIMNILDANTLLIDHYKPITEEILKRLEEFESPKDKINYLKSEELKYLIDVKMNPNLKTASGVVTTSNPHKAGLDGWIETTIKQIENSSSQSKAQNKISYVWQNDSVNELPELYDKMIEKYKLIASETTYEQFEAVFTGQPIQSINPIKWHQDNASELLYFISRLEQTNNIIHNPKRADHQMLKACFVKPDGKSFDGALKTLKQQIDFLSKDKQKTIDELVKIFS